MHLLISHAAPDEPADAAGPWPALQLPALQALVARWRPAMPDVGDADALIPPHERALARALGWTDVVGALPWAARDAAADGVVVGTRAWALLTPVHLDVGRDRVHLLDPAELRLSDTESAAFLEALRPLFEGVGWTLAWGAPLRWYAAHDSLAGLATASLDRVVGRSVEAWLPKGAASAGVRRLQAEAQMLLYTHPLNEEREARGAPTVNSFWLSGCGRARPADDSGTVVDHRLRAPLRARDWPAWHAAWDALDRGPVAGLLATARSGEPAALTLCGERSAQRYDSGGAGWRQRLAGMLHPRSVTAVLQAL